MVPRSEMLRFTIDQFSFLPEVGECELELIEANTLLTTVAYKFATIAVELHFDWRDLGVMCCISMPSDGHLPGGYLLHDGKRIRFRLGDLTPEVLAKFKQLPRPPKRRPPLDKWSEWQFERMTDSVRIYAEILRSNFADLRSKAESGFYPD